MVPREVVSSDRPRGWITTTGPLSVVGDDPPRERVCEWGEWYCKTVTGPQLYLTA